MATIQNKEINNLIKEEHSLIRQYDKNEISQSEYMEKSINIKSKILELTQEHIKKLKNKMNNKIKEYEDKKMETENNKKPEEKVENKVEEKKIGRKPKKDSMASLIANELSKKTVKNFDMLYDKIVAIKSDADKKKVIAFAKTIIRECKKGKGRWKIYTWDDENFLLTLKE